MRPTIITSYLTSAEFELDVARFGAHVGAVEKLESAYELLPGDGAVGLRHGQAVRSRRVPTVQPPGRRIPHLPGRGENSNNTEW